MRVLTGFGPRFPNVEAAGAHGGTVEMVRSCVDQLEKRWVLAQGWERHQDDLEDEHTVAGQRERRDGGFVREEFTKPYAACAKRRDAGEEGEQCQQEPRSVHEDTFGLDPTWVGREDGMLEAFRQPDGLHDGGDLGTQAQALDQVLKHLEPTTRSAAKAGGP